MTLPSGRSGDLRELASQLVNVERHDARSTVRAARHAGAHACLADPTDRIAHATVYMANLLDHWWTDAGTGTVPGQLDLEVECARLELAEALDITAPGDLEFPSAHKNFSPADPLDGCRFGGKHVRYPGGRYPSACLRCGRRITTNQEVSHS